MEEDAREGRQLVESHSTESTSTQFRRLQSSATGCIPDGDKRGDLLPPDGDIYNRETAMQLGSKQSPKGQLGGTGRGGGGGGLVQKREHNKKWPLGAEAKVDRG